MDRAVDTDLDLAGSSVLPGNAQIDISGLSHTFANVEVAALLQTQQCTQHDDEDGHKDKSADESHQHEQTFALNGGSEADSAPSEPQEEVDEVAQGEQREDAGRTQGAFVTRVARRDVGLAAHIAV